MQRQPARHDRRKQLRSAALRAQGLMVANVARTAIPHRDAKLPIRADGEEWTHAGSLGLVGMGGIAAAADFMMQRLMAVGKDIMRGIRVTSLGPSLRSSTTATKGEPQMA